MGLGRAGGKRLQFSFTREQEEFRAVLRRFLQDKSPSAEVRRRFYCSTALLLDCSSEAQGQSVLLSTALLLHYSSEAQGGGFADGAR